MCINCLFLNHKSKNMANTIIIKGTKDFIFLLECIKTKVKKKEEKFRIESNSTTSKASIYSKARCSNNIEFIFNNEIYWINSAQYSGFHIGFVGKRYGFKNMSIDFNMKGNVFHGEDYKCSKLKSLINRLHQEGKYLQGCLAYDFKVRL